MFFAEGTYNPDEIIYPTYSDKSYNEESRKEIDKIIEKYGGKIYVKIYNNLDELNDYMNAHMLEDSDAIIYDPEVSNKRIELIRADRINELGDEFQAIFIDKENYNPDEIIYPTYSDKSYREDTKKKIDKIIEEYDGKIYVKTYNNLDEFKDYIDDHMVGDSEMIIYDPELSDRQIEFLMAYRIKISADKFQAIFIDYVDS
ncbi:hypothetical protein [Tepidimicrobium xylanilyticum]